jgi:putative transposase
MCALATVSRAGFYRFPSLRCGSDAAVELRDAMQRIALEFPSYGWPRMTEELKRRGWAVNHKRVYRLMREDNLLCLRRKKFVVTTDSAHTLPVYPNLARQMKLTGLDQLWVADITYIRLRAEFVYLAVILDAFSRRVIGWALGRTLEDTLTLRALRMALDNGSPHRGWCITPTAACNMPPASIPICCARRGSSSACRAKPIRTTTPKPSRS